jgi:hypothetical protein
MTSFRDIIRLWPTYAAAAAAIGVSRETIKSWAKRDSIPAAYDLHVVRAAPVVTLEVLARLRAAEPTSVNEAAA